MERPTEADEQPRLDKPEDTNDNSEKEQGDEHGFNVRALKRDSLDASVSMAEPGLSLCDSGVEAGAEVAANVVPASRRDADRPRRHLLQPLGKAARVGWDRARVSFRSR